MRGKSGVLIVVLLSLLVLTSGCQMMSERFLPPDEQDKSITNEDLPVPATSRDPFTFPTPITLKRGGKTTLEVGFYNTLPAKAKVLVASPDAEVGFGIAQTESTVLCEDSREYEFTVDFESTMVNVSVGEANGFPVTIIDSNGIMADNITCPISLFDALSAKKVATEDLVITITG